MSMMIGIVLVAAGLALIVLGRPTAAGEPNVIIRNPLGAVLYPSTILGLMAFGIAIVLSAVLSR
jgi:hypothetical protein